MFLYRLSVQCLATLETCCHTYGSVPSWYISYHVLWCYHDNISCPKADATQWFFPVWKRS